MENASKALIIAGAILLSILLISLGIMVFQQASGVFDSNPMDELQITQFNQKFTRYENTRASGSTVRGMLSTILSNNIAADSDDRKIVVYLGSEEILKKDATSVDNSKIATGSTYTVKCEYSASGGNKGLVNKIVVTDNKNTPSGDVD